MKTSQFLLDIDVEADMEDERGREVTQYLIKHFFLTIRPSTALDIMICATLVSLAMKHRGLRMPDSSDFVYIA